jgi:hypothetical protein
MKNLTIRTLVAVGTLGLSPISQAMPISAPIQNPANNHYYFLLGSDNWTASQSQALSLGGNLVTINDAAENAWVVTTFLNYGGMNRDLWTGLNDAATEGTYQWASGEPFTYSNWQPGQPDNGGGYYPNENYVHIYGGTTTEQLPGWTPGKWNDLQDIAGYTSNTGTSRQIFGVVEVVPEPSVNILLLSAGSLLVWLRSRSARNAAA